MTTIPAQQSHISGLCGTPRARWARPLWENPRARGANVCLHCVRGSYFGKPPRSRGQPSQPDKNYHTPQASSFNPSVERTSRAILQTT